MRDGPDEPIGASSLRLKSPADPSGADWRHAVEEEAGKLAAGSPELGAILRSSVVRTQIEVYTQLDGEATAQQRRFIRELTVANICLMLAGVLSGVVLAGGAMPELLGDLWTKRTTLTLGLVTLALGAIAAMLSFRARESERLRRWLSKRSRAEMARLAAFRAIATAGMQAGHPVAGHALTIIREHLLDEQRSWLRKRAARHWRSAEWTALWGGLATALAFVGGSGAVIASFASEHAWIPIIGVIGAALAAYAANREGLRRDRPNADRYEKACVALDELAARYDTVAAEVAAGKPEALVAFTEAVTDQLASEHKQWLEGATQAEAALAKLDSQLRQLRGGQGPEEGERPAGAGGRRQQQ